MIGKASFFASIATLTSGVDYQRFSDAMKHYGYTWEAVKVTTEDGFFLTTFHVLGKTEKTFKPNLPPVLLQHGEYVDGVVWVEYDAYDNKRLPMALQLA